MTLEAMLSFALFLALLGAFAGIEAMQSAKASEAAYKFSAELESCRCALVIDSFYANSGGALQGFGSSCYMKGTNSVAAQVRGFEKESAILNSGTKLIQTPRGTRMEVQVNEHYR
ncbi:MAG: hypothetical protein V1676_01725 [Candidatus Diapherotrites archaeon]